MHVFCVHEYVGFVCVFYVLYDRGSIPGQVIPKTLKKNDTWHLLA